MQLILQYFWQMCRLKAGPEQLPGSYFALAATFSIYFILALITVAINQSQLEPLQVPVSVLSGVLIQAIVVLGILSFKGVRQRFVPVMTALFGTNAIILIITMPLNGLLEMVQAGPIRQFVEILFLATFFWWLAIAGFILHRSAKVSLVQGMVIVFAVEIMVMLITFNLFPVEAQA
ncbi:MAG: hypothetical protein WD002_15400 [Pseudomonadales bacterium]